MAQNLFNLFQQVSYTVLDTFLGEKYPSESVFSSK